MAALLTIFAYLVPLMFVSVSSGHTDDTCKCGVPRLGTRIVGGRKADLDTHPWQVALVQLVGYNKYYVCGGTLINDRWVLTAAHCLVDDPPVKSTFKVAIGAQTMRRILQSSYQVAVESVNVHPLFARKPIIVNDIALVKLAQPVDGFGTSRIPICLPSGPMPLDNLVACGWGKMSEGVRAETLQEIQFEPMDDATCSLAWTERFDGQKQLCVGQAGHRVGLGDSGGPLATKFDGQYYQVGISSFRPLGDNSSRPDVFLRVSSYLGFIYETIMYKHMNDDSRWCT